MDDIPVLPEASWRKLPRWRGFNLLNRFSASWSNRPFAEEDFRLLHDLRFNFVRLPLDYRTWCPDGNLEGTHREVLEDLDRAVGWGRRWGVHVCLNFHRAPGYCINPPAEKLELWKSDEALRTCADNWAMFAKRYRGLPNRELSFNLLNEPKGVDDRTYVRVCSALCDAIRKEDKDRLILCDGNECGTKPVEGLIPLEVGQCTRGYQPFELTHFMAPWVEGSGAWPTPTWPGPDGWDAVRHWKECIEPWKALENQGVGVMVGEWGVYRKTPHATALGFMRDALSNFRKAGWGWALWNLSGDFGPFDSGREDVSYESHGGRQLDRRMLELLQEE